VSEAGAPAGVTCRLLSQAWFEAARHIPSAPPGHRSARLHGHGFRVQALLPSEPAHAGAWDGALDRLEASLAAAAGALDHRLVNDAIADPTDEAIAHWLAARLPAGVAIGLRAARATGIERTPDATTLGWRRYRFEAAHRLPGVPSGHKCGRMHGHGFEVVVQVRGPCGPATGERIDAAWAPLGAQLNGACLNEIAGLENPTSEILCRWIRARLADSLDAIALVAVSETRSSGAVFDGTHYGIWKELSLDSAIRAPGGGAVLGHTWLLRLHLGAPLDKVLGWTVDFGDVKERFAPLFDLLDHRPLHTNFSMQARDSCSLAHWILREGAMRLPELRRIDLHETPARGVVLDRGGAPFFLPP
jgi:6-pyruvoyltetrahydropterin/6-carboxytetrahydropterin synthase